MIVNNCLLRLRTAMVAVTGSFILLLPMLGGSAQAFEQINYQNVFPAVAQGTRASLSLLCLFVEQPQLGMYDSSKINGTKGNSLQYCNSNLGTDMPADACDTAGANRDYCQINRSSQVRLSSSSGNGFLYSNGSGTIGNCNYGDQFRLGYDGRSQFNTVRLYKDCDLSFSPAQTEYRLRTLDIGGGATVTLSSGDYWIESLTVNTNGHLRIEGNVRLFVSTGLINSGLVDKSDASALTVVAYNNLSLDGSGRLEGYVYGFSRVYLNDSSVINGRVTSAALLMTGTSQLNDADRFTLPNLTCFTDNFSSSSLPNWVVARSSGSFPPSTTSQGRLRMTQAVANQATSATYQRLFPGEGNYITAEFNHYAYGGNGADGMALVLSDAAVTPRPGAFGGPLGYGYKPGITGFAGGWLGIGLDEYGNYSSEGGDYNYDGILRQTVAVRGSGRGTSGYNFLTAVCDTSTLSYFGYGICMSPNIDGNNNLNHQYRLTLDSRNSGRAMLKIERNTGTGYSTIVDNFNVLNRSGQVALPQNLLLSLTGSTGQNFNVHEVDNMRICALKSTAITGVIDHFEIEINDSPLTCTPLSMTLKACKNASCSELYTDPVTATLAPEGNSWLPSNPVSFSGGSTTIQLSHTQAGPVTLDVTGSTPVTKAFSTTLCRQNGGALSNAACTVNFSDSGFVFDVPDKLAAKPIDVLIKAVKKDDITKRCVSAFASTPKNLKFWSSVVDRPSIASYTPPPVTVNSRAIASTTVSAESQSVQFNAQGEATVTVNYDDAGKLALHAQYIGSGIDAGLVMDGDDAFVSFPVGLCVTAPEPNADCASGNASCSAFRAAGDPFTLNIRAKRWHNNNSSNICSNGDTPSFAMNAVSLSHQLVAPQNGQLGDLAQRDYAQLASVSGTNVQQTVAEVGVFRFAANSQLPYLGSQAYVIPAYFSDPVGRFYPAGFKAENSHVVSGCGAFTYMAQPFYLSTNLSARNRSGQLTQNYTGSFADGVARLQAANNLDGIDLSARLSALAGQWNNGQMSFSQAPVTFSRPLAPQADGPYSALALGVRIDDRDLVPMLDADMRADADGSCTGSCNARKLATIDMRLGRAVLFDTYGPENQSVVMNGQSQYWDGQQWRLNTDDSCSLVTPAMQTQQSDAALGYLFEPSLSNGQQIIREGAPAQISQGKFGIRWKSSGAYQGKVTAPVVVPDYLKWYWQFDGVSNLPQDPRASVYFGRYRGHDRIINWREVR